MGEIARLIDRDKSTLTTPADAADFLGYLELELDD
jgi:hypothetical protein